MPPAGVGNGEGREGIDEGRPQDRRVVTSLFADLAGSTAVAEQLDPEDWAEVADRGLSLMSESIARFGGTVARLMGDGILALFGAPDAHEDDAERAVRAGLDLVDRVGPLREHAAGLGAALDETCLRARVGVATGEVVAGLVGSAVRSEYTVLGDVVNLAARLEQVAVPGTVVLSEATVSAVSHAVETVPLGEVELKGVASPVFVHRAVEVRVERGSGRGLGRPTRSVGRRDELEALTRVMDRLADGEGGVIAIVGEAGLGKTRLITDARALTIERRLGWVEAAALSFEEGSALALARRLLAACGGSRSETLTSHLEALAPDRRRLVGEVLGSVEGHDSATDVTPAAVAIAFDELTSALTTTRPAVLVIDDLHWADAGSADVAMSMMASTDRKPLVVVAASRPVPLVDRIVRSVPRGRVRIDLEALSFDETADLIGMLVPGVGPPPGRLVRVVWERSGGNPYFVEEIVREMLRLGAVDPMTGWRFTGNESDLPVPESLQRLLQARFGGLTPHGRHVLEVAAVIGRTFDEGLAWSLVGGDPSPGVAELVELGVLERDDAGHVGFRHALAREAAHESILRRRRRLLHGMVGEALERAGRPDPAVLLEHFAAAGDAHRVARYAAEAGERALALASYADGYVAFDRGLTIEVPTAEAKGRLLLGRGRCREVLGDIDGAIADLEEALAISRGNSLDALEWETLTTLGLVWAARDYTCTGVHHMDALEVARRAGDRAMIASALNRVGNWAVNAADPVDGIGKHEQALELFEQIDSIEGRAESHDLLGMAAMLTGDRGRSRRHYEAALPLFERLGQRRGVAGALISRAVGTPNYEELAEVPMETIDDAEPAIRSALAITIDLGWAAGEAFARFMLSQVLSCAGRLGEGFDEGRRSLEIAERIGHDQWRVGAMVCLGAATADVFDLVGARLHLEEAYELSERVGSLNWRLQVAPLLAWTLLDQGDPDRAASLLAEVMRLDHADRFLPYRSCRMVAALIEGLSGRVGAALDNLTALQPGTGVAPRLELVRGQVLATVDPAAAVPVLERSVEAATVHRIPAVAMRAHATLAVADPDRAGGHRAAGRGLVDMCAASLDSEGAEAMRRRATQVLGL